MRKMVWILAFCLAVWAPGLAGPAPLIYINNQAAVPADSVLVDARGDCWVDAAYLPLTPDEKVRLGESKLAYQEFYQGEAYLNLNLIAPALGWTVSGKKGTLIVTTPAYRPFTGSGEPPEENRPSVTTVISYTPTQSEVRQQQQDAADAYFNNYTPPYMYYYSGADTGYYGNYGGYGRRGRGGYSRDNYSAPSRPSKAQRGYITGPVTNNRISVPASGSSLFGW